MYLSSRLSLEIGRGLRAAFFLCFSLVTLGFVSPNAEAGSFQISPTLGDVAVNQSTSTFRIRNSGDTPLTVQVTAQKWSQQDNEDVLSDAPELLIVPPLVIVAPGQSQLIRIAHRSRNSNQEQAYRAFFTEVPAAPEPGFLGVQTMLRMSLPLFFAPSRGAHDLRWSANRSSPDRLSLEVENQGGRYARISTIILLDRNGERLAQVQGPQYVLSGAPRSWEIPPSIQISGEQLRVRVEFGSSEQEYPLASDQ